MIDRIDNKAVWPVPRAEAVSPCVCPVCRKTFYVAAHVRVCGAWCPSCRERESKACPT